MQLNDENLQMNLHQTEDTTIKREPLKPDYILVYNFVNRCAVEVPRLKLSQRRKCKHVFKPTVEGHGKWRRGCNKCGALSR